jgi:F-type H+-transporting ATPase subunit b
MGSLASSAWASDEGGGANPFAGDVGNAVWTLVIFVLVLVVLGKFAWGPILGALQKREDFIRDSLEQAKRDRDEAAKQLAGYEKRLAESKAEASAIVDEGRRDAEVLKGKIEAKAKAEADVMVERAKREIGLATDTARKELYDLAAKLATDVASRVIGEELDAAKHERLIAESIEQIEKARRN